MKVKSIWQRLVSRTRSRSHTSDWTNSWSLRDLADLPHHHPNRDDH